MNETQRTRLGWFQSLTPASYILLSLLLAAGLGGSGYLLLGTPGEEEDSLPQAQTGAQETAKFKPFSGPDPQKGPDQNSVQPSAARERVPAPSSQPELRYLVRKEPETTAEEGAEKARTAEQVTLSETDLGLEDAQSSEKETAQGVEQEPEPEPVQESRKAGGTVASTPRLQGEETVWVVQYSTNRNEELASEWAGRLKGMGNVAYVWKTATEPPLYLLRMGFFRSQESARATAQDVGSRVGLHTFTLKQASEEEVETHHPKR